MSRSSSYTPDSLGWQQVHTKTVRDCELQDVVAETWEVNCTNTLITSFCVCKLEILA